MVNAMLNNSGLSKGYWGEALLTACHIQNRLPHKKTHVTPYELWKKKRPNISYFKVWGCRAIVRLPLPKITKLGDKGVECIFLGYAEHSKGYRFIVIEKHDSIKMSIVVESKDAVFYENAFSSLANLEPIPPKVGDKRLLDLNDLEDEVENSLENSDQPRRSKRIRKEKSFGPDFITYLVEGNRGSDETRQLVSPSVESDPLTYKEAMSSSDSSFWKEALDDEMNSIIGNHTWELVDLPSGAKPLPGRWLFKKKLKVDGTIEKYKCRYVIGGHKQKGELDGTSTPMFR